MRSSSHVVKPNGPTTVYSTPNKPTLKSADLAALAIFDELPDLGWVREPVVRALFGYPGRTTLWNYVRNGILPKPEKLGSQTNVWNVGKIRAALAKRGA